MKADPRCVYCGGTGRAHHVQPDNVSDELWFEFQGFGHCPVCAGWKRAGMVRYQDGPAAIVLFLAARERRTLSTCPETGCDQWHDITRFMPGPGSEPENDVTTQCPRGHTMVLAVVDA